MKREGGEGGDGKNLWRSEFSEKKEKAGGKDQRERKFSGVFGDRTICETSKFKALAERGRLPTA